MLIIEDGIVLPGDFPEISLIGGKPLHGPLSHGSIVPDHQTALVFLQQVLGFLLDLPLGFPVDHLLAAVREGDLFLIPTVLSLFHEKHLQGMTCKACPEVV